MFALLAESVRKARSQTDARPSPQLMGLEWEPTAILAEVSPAEHESADRRQRPDKKWRAGRQCPSLENQERAGNVGQPVTAADVRPIDDLWPAGRFDHVRGTRIRD